MEGLGTLSMVVTVELLGELGLVMLMSSSSGVVEDWLGIVEGDESVLSGMT